MLQCRVICAYIALARRADLADYWPMRPVPTLLDGNYPFRENVYPLAEMAMSEAPSELANFVFAQAEANSIKLVRDEVSELVCRGDGIPELRFTIYWPSGGGLHVLVPKRYIVGRA